MTPEIPDDATPMMAQYLAIKRPIPTACCSTGWAISTKCSSTTPPGRRGAGHRPDPAGQAPGRGHPDVRGAGAGLPRAICRGWCGPASSVAICEQTEDPAEARKRGGKSVVARDVIRLVTAGTLTEDNLLDARAHNYLAAVAEAAGRAGAGLGRRVHRRFLAASGGDVRAGGGAGPLGSGRAAGTRAPAAGRDAVRAVGRLQGGVDPPALGSFRFRKCPPPPGGAVRRRRAGRLRGVLAGRAGGGRRPGRLRRADPEGQAAAPVDTATAGRGGGDGDRRRHPRAISN